MNLPSYGTHVKVGTPIGRVATPYPAHTQPPTDPWASTIDPADVKVGDVVEVEAADGSWLVRGEVTDLAPASDYPFRFLLWHGRSNVLWPRVADTAIVRLVRRAEPEPDPEQVERLVIELINAKAATTTEVRPDVYEQMARHLLRRGVRVQPEEQP